MGPEKPLTKLHRTASVYRMNEQGIPPVVGNSQGSTIKFSIDRWDLIQCRLWVLTQNRFIVLFTLGCSLFAALRNLAAPQAADRSMIFKIVFVVVLTALVFGLLALVQVIVHVTWAYVGKNQGVLGPQEIVIREDGLVVRCDVNESFHRWTGFRRMRSVGGYIFLYVGGNIVYYVPLRIFPTQQAAEDFKNEIRGHAQPA